MRLGQLVRRVQINSGLSYKTSKEIIIMLVESLASRLDDQNRQVFAANLPEKLQDIALSVYPATGHYDIIAHFMYYQNIGKFEAQRRITAAWQAISDSLSLPATEVTAPLIPISIKRRIFPSIVQVFQRGTSG
ncbi:MAG: hypothetical protein ACREHG_07045 [Candidatus Saccharimonadales bacterium]